MSCNGCRILRKGCSENCILRQSLQCIQSPQSQANATVFVAKFFGRAGLMSFLSSVSESHRPELFQSLLYEACGRTVNPVSGAVGLQWTGNWHVCQSAVATVLSGGVLPASPELEEGLKVMEDDDLYASRDMNLRIKRKGFDAEEPAGDLNLRLTAAGLAARMTAGGRVKRRREKIRPTTPSDESETTTLESGFASSRQELQQNNYRHETKLLRLFF